MVRILRAPHKHLTSAIVDMNKLWEYDLPEDTRIAMERLITIIISN